MRWRLILVRGWILWTFSLLMPHTVSAERSVQTVGGITYFTETVTLPVCIRTEIGPVSRIGTNLVLTMTEKRGEVCIFCIDCYNIETSTVVLGSLPPGAYQLTIYSSPYFYPPLPFQDSWIIRFEVPESETKAIAATRTPTGLRLDVVGVTGATYLVESSSNLASWSGVHTNSGAPFHLDLELSRPTAGQFYRVRVLAGKTSGPAPPP